MNYKKYFIAWLSTFIATCIGVRIYAIKQATDFTVDQFREITSSFGYIRFLAIFIACWSLPLSIITYIKSKGASKKTRLILGIIVIWLILGLLACISLLIKEAL